MTMTFPRFPDLAEAVPAPVDAAPRRGPYARFFKRALDIALVTLAAPVVLPVVGLAALAVAGDGASPFYRQDRVGLDGRLFGMWKLRSMVPDAETLLEGHLARDPAARAEWDSTQKLRNDPRITAVCQ
jgi:exopolysaccharide production protein ExoY